jgi:hypothetical protein
MAVAERVERRVNGINLETGEKTYYTTFTGQPDIKSLGDWCEVRLSAVRQYHGAPADLARRMLAAIAAGEDLAAVVKDGKPLDAWERYGVLLTLRQWRELADDFAPAYAPVRELERQWVARFGETKPKPVRLSREARMGLA